MTQVSLEAKKRIRLAEFSLLLAVSGIDAGEFAFISREAQPGFVTDIESIRQETSRTSNRRERLVSAFLPSLKNSLPDEFVQEQHAESDLDPGIIEDKTLEFWSCFDTTTYRFWISFHMLKLRMLLYCDDVDCETLYWARFGGDRPSLGWEERKYLLLLRCFAPFFRGRRLLYERVLPAFVKKPVTVEENVPNRVEVPENYRSAMGKANCGLGRNLFPGDSFVENHSTFRVNVEGLERSDIGAFRPGGSSRILTEQLLSLFTPANLRALVRYRFAPGLKLFIPGKEAGKSYLGFSTYLRET